MEELVSVIIPAYNSEKYIRKCLDSVVNQNYDNLEIIIVNDASTDNTLSICEEYKKADNRIKIINHAINSGLVAARKNGILAAGGEYSMPLDSDDWVELDIIKQLMDWACRQHCDIVKCGTIYEFVNKSTVRNENLYEGVYDMSDLNSPVYESFFVNKDDKKSRGINGNVWGTIYKTTLLRENQLLVDEKIRCGEDDACFFPSLLNAEKFGFIDKQLYHYRQVPESMSHEVGMYTLEEVMLLEKRLREACQYKPNKDQLFEQLDYYMMIRLKRFIDKGLNIDSCTGTYLFPYHKIAPKSKVILYGAGKVGKAYYSQIKKNEYCNIILWVDANAKLSEEDNVRSIYDIKESLHEYDSVVIAISNENTAMQIKEYLVNQGVDADKIVWTKPDYIGW